MSVLSLSVRGTPSGTVHDRHPFSRLPHSSGELLHTPYRIPTSMATALISIHGHSLCGFDKHVLDPLDALMVHPTAPVLLTKTDPLDQSLRGYTPIQSLLIDQEAQDLPSSLISDSTQSAFTTTDDVSHVVAFSNPLV